MKQNILDVLAYLFEVAAQAPRDFSYDRNSVLDKLQRAGFNNDAVERTFDWLENLVQQKYYYEKNPIAHKNMRVFDSAEMLKIDMAARQYILYLENLGVLDANLREVVINQLLQLKQRVVTKADVKWVVLLVILGGSKEHADKMRKFFLANMQ